MSQSNEFLSGEADCTIGSLLGSLTVNKSNDQQNPLNVGTAEASTGVKIEIIDSEEGSDNEGDSDIPPPLDSKINTGTVSPVSISTHTKATEEPGKRASEAEIDGKSIMESMMEEAMVARKTQEEQKKKSERKHASTSSFGFKKGFLSASSSKKDSKKKNKTKTIKAKAHFAKQDVKMNDERKIYELDAQGNIILEAKNKVDVPLHGSQLLHLQEVQEAMNETNVWNNFANKDWTSPDLLDRISKNPKLIAGMANPKFTAALQALRDNPKEATHKFKDHKDVTEFLNEYCSVLGDHFTKLGEEQTTSKSEGPKQSQSQKQGPREQDIGPIAFRALQKDKERKARGQKSLSEETLNKKEKEQYDAVMKNEELTSILMEVSMQKVLQECSTIPGKMQFYMRHGEYGQKLRKLIQAGLLKVV